MLDLKLIRTDPDVVKQALRDRLLETDGPPIETVVDEILRQDHSHRDALHDLEHKRHLANQASDAVAEKKAEQADPAADIEAARSLKREIAQLDARVRELSADLDAKLLSLPNLPHADVPVGAGDADDVLVTREGEERSFHFEPKPHWELAEGLGIVDAARAAKLSGAGFVTYIGAGAALARALVNLMLDVHTSQHGYEEVAPPQVVRQECVASSGAGSLDVVAAGFRPAVAGGPLRPGSSDVVAAGFRPAVAGGPLRPGSSDVVAAGFRPAVAGGCLRASLTHVPSPEVPLTNLHRGEILDAAELPKCYAASVVCLRGRGASRGVIGGRQHTAVQLAKFTAPETAGEQFRRLVADAEAILKLLEIPYRVVALCTANLPAAAAKTMAIRVRCAGSDEHIEVSSCSVYDDYQARRCGTRYRPGPNTRPRFVHTMSGAGLLVEPTMAALLENYQREDQRVDIPKVLRPYMRGMATIGE